MNAQRLAQKIGLVGLLGILLLGSAAWTRLAWLPQQEAEVAALASQARQARHALLDQAAITSAGKDASPSSPEQAWQLLWQSLPTADARVGLQSDVLDQARKQGLQISTVQYQGSEAKWANEGGVALWRQRMLMPVDGPYASVRAWLAGLLSQPALSIDSVDLQRADVMNDQVKGRVAVSLWWRKVRAPSGLSAPSAPSAPTALPVTSQQVSSVGRDRQAGMAP